MVGSFSHRYQLRSFHKHSQNLGFNPSLREEISGRQVLVVDNAHTSLSMVCEMLVVLLHAFAVPSSEKKLAGIVFVKRLFIMAFDNQSISQSIGQ